MIEKRFRENKTSPRGMYIRSIADITLEWKDIHIADIIPDWNDICSIADIPELYAIGRLRRKRIFIKMPLAKLNRKIQKGRS